MKDWNPRIIPGGRRFRRGTRWNPIPGAGRRKGWRLSAGEIRLMVFGGVMAGLAFAIVDRPEQTSGAAAPIALTGGGDAVRVSPAAVRVIDGDTFGYRGMRVRVADIDTPETEGRCAYETRLAALATRRMRGLLAEGPFELRRLPNGRDEDRYGRKLRIVTRGGRSLGDQLVAEGLARTWTGRREPWC
ncbi:thermonuclease family protein [Sphingosinicella sp. LHD-64]|uniref:thermonuclease family protein n=1 Tax=Sphingosinicella sp. LHD-64 TaxID=3072139 RepID=UPI00280E1EF5|nr:thermonuclease family protein [Sphingosinicella sp. LHD-64]MDQ8756657.1 thermonuclease family protein [Sphingosinicella sp. LHD-64]